MEKVKLGYQNVKDVKGALHRGDSYQGTHHKKLHKHRPDDPTGYMPMKPPSERVTNPGPALPRPTRAPPIPVPAPEALPDRYEKMESPEKRLLGNPNYRSTLQHHQNAINQHNPNSVFKYAGNQTLPSRPVPPTPSENYSNFNPVSQVVDLQYQAMAPSSVVYQTMNLNDSLDFNFESPEYLQMGANGPAEYLQMSGNDQTEYLNFEPPPAGEYLQMGGNEPVEYLNFESESRLFKDIMFEDAHQSDF